MNEYLESTEIIDWKDPRIVALANDLAFDAADQKSVAKAVYEWVRDKFSTALTSSDAKSLVGLPMFSRHERDSAMPKAIWLPL